MQIQDYVQPFASMDHLFHVFQDRTWLVSFLFLLPRRYNLLPSHSSAKVRWPIPARQIVQTQVLDKMKKKRLKKHNRNRSNRNRWPISVFFFFFFFFWKTETGYIKTETEIKWEIVPRLNRYIIGVLNKSSLVIFAPFTIFKQAIIEMFIINFLPAIIWNFKSSHSTEWLP